MRRTVWQWWTDEEGEEKGLTFSQRTPCRACARIPRIHRAGASDLESNQSPGTRTARIGWTGNSSSGSKRIEQKLDKKFSFRPP